MNVVVLIGRLGAKPELKYTPHGLPVATFSIAVDRPGKDKGTDWFNVTAWRQSAEYAAQYLDKGALVAVDGRLEQNKWQAQDGQKRETVRVQANRVQGLGARQQAGEQADAPAHDPDTDNPFGE